LGVVFVATPLVAEAAPIVISTFDAGTEGWTIVADGTGPVWNPGGYITTVDLGLGQTIYWVAPAAFLGDQSAAYGGTLAFDLRQSATNGGFDATDIFLSNGPTTLAFDLATNPLTVFTHFAVALLAPGWKVGSIAGPDATAAQMQAVLGSLTSLRIRAEFRSGADTDDLDNVSLNAAAAVPEPSIVLLLASGIWAIRRRTRSDRRRYFFPSAIEG
jgi:hypothetical protein